VGRSVNESRPHFVRRIENPHQPALQGDGLQAGKQAAKGMGRDGVPFKEKTCFSTDHFWHIWLQF
jgi:hypothetical protein